MKYAEVAVNAPMARPRTFTYTLPPRTSISEGCAVWVPFGPRHLQGVVFQLSDHSPVAETKEIVSVIDSAPLLSGTQIELARWIAEHYLASYFDSASLMLPPGFEQKTLTYIELLPSLSEETLTSLSPLQKRAIRFLQKNDRVEAQQLKKTIPQKYIKTTIKQLEKRKLIKSFTRLQDLRIKPRFVDYVQLKVTPQHARREAARLLAAKRAPKKAELLDFLLGATEPIPVALVKQNIRCSDAVIRALVDEQIIEKNKVGKITMLKVNRQRASDVVGSLRGEKGDKQLGKLLTILSEADRPMSISEVCAESNTLRSAVKELGKRGLVSISRLRLTRDPLAHRQFPPLAPLKLTPMQEAVWNQIQKRLCNPLSRDYPSTFLLHGITGSGKTEIYHRALKETIDAGKRAIVLVPEIAMTPQTIARFASRFPDRVAVLHSKLSPGEQFDEWHRIREGEFDVVVGSRSAIFAPQPDLGLIVIDEEHEWTYKQHDRPPFYHARDVALKLAALNDSVVILGSATPDIESYHHARRGDYRLLELPERVGETNNGVYPSLPWVEIVDLRQELRQGNRSIFSRSLARAINNALASGEQAILFLNRRGAASFVQCRDCGYVMRCRSCDVPLTYHAQENELICHRCNYRVSPPEVCPECRSRRIKFLGIGTQKVEEETAKAFPQARILRWDRDVTKGKYSHEEILDKFQSHEADILIGTQMVAKGLDIPLVTLVGVISADVGLYLPDFRAGERTFQLLAQVTGRAGRGIRGGNAIIQTYTPEHYAIVAAANQDFQAFYEQEIALRHQYRYPPFSRLANMVYAHTNAERCQKETARMTQVLREERDAQGLANTVIIGPSPAYIQRVRGRYRWQVIVRSPDPMSILARIPIPQGWTVDLDPVGLT